MSSFKKTGDIKGNTESLIRNLKVIKYPSQTNFKILSSGNPEIYLPIIHYSLFNYSPLVAKFLSDKHYDMYAKNDLDFINTAFKCLITLFNYRPDINTNQFFSNGYAEGKVILCKEIIDIVLQKDLELSKKKKGTNSNKYSKDSYKNDNMKNNNNNANNNSPRFHELNNSRNSHKKNNNMNNNNNNNNNNSSYVDDNNNSVNNNNIDLNNINNNFNASLPMNSIPVPTPKPQYLIPKNNSNYNNIQSSVQSFKPKTNNQIEIYDSSQEYPLGGQAYDPSVNNSNNGNLQNSNNNSMDFNSIVKIITSLSESVSQMVNKIEKFKTNIEDRLNKVEAEIVLIKNKQNYIESKLNNDNTSNDSNNLNRNYNNSINRNNYSNENQKNSTEINNNYKMNDININRKENNNNNKMDDNYINPYYPNSLNNKNIYNKDLINNENNKINNINNNDHHQIFASFGQNITLNPEGNTEENNSKIFYEQSMNNNNPKNFNNTASGYAPYLEENKVFNVFSYTQANEENFNNNSNNNINNNYNINNLNNDTNDIKNKYADIDKLIENSEKNFFKTQKLLEDYENTDISKKKSNL